MKNKEFAEKNAGKYFLHMGMKVRVVGYCSGNNHSIIVSLPKNEHGFGWSAQVLDEVDVFVTRSRASRFWYADGWELKKWE